MLSNRSRWVAAFAVGLLCISLFPAPAARAEDGSTVSGWWQATIDFLVELVLPPDGGTDPASDPANPDPGDPQTGDPGGGDIGGWADPDG